MTKLTDAEWDARYWEVHGIITGIPGVYSAHAPKAARQIMDLFTGCQDCERVGHPMGDPCTNGLKPFTRPE